MISEGLGVTDSCSPGPGLGSPTPPRSAEDVRGAHGLSADGSGPITLLLDFLGAGLCVPYLYTSAGPTAILVFAAAWTVVRICARHARSLAVRIIVRAFSAGVYAVCAYAAVVFTIVLGWSLPRWAIAVIVGTSVAAVATRLLKSRALRVPALLPLGLLITTVLSGWWREGGRVRCDDFFRVKQQPGVEVVVPSVSGLAACRPGAMLPLNRYPRQIWEAPDGRALVFTTQAEPFAADTADAFAGAVCSVPSDGGTPRCSGTGKGDGIAEIPAHDRLVALSYGGLDGRGHLYIIPIDDPFRNPETVLVENAGSGIYDPDLDVLFVFGNDGKVVQPIRAGDMRQTDRIVVLQPVLADYGHYDGRRHEGIMCGVAGPVTAVMNGGRSYLATALRGEPFALQPMGSSPLGWVAFSFGCDWDPVSRRVFVALPNLGAIAELDYDTGRIVDVARARVGLRYLRYDAPRRRIYSSDFLRGWVVELDADSKRELRSWFVGRFARDVRLTRDGNALLAATNVGVIRIRL